MNRFIAWEKLVARVRAVKSSGEVAGALPDRVFAPATTASLPPHAQFRAEGWWIRRMCRMFRGVRCGTPLDVFDKAGLASRQLH